MTKKLQNSRLPVHEVFLYPKYKCVARASVRYFKINVALFCSTFPENVSRPKSESTVVGHNVIYHLSPSGLPTRMHAHIPMDHPRLSPEYLLNFIPNMFVVVGDYF